MFSAGTVSGILSVLLLVSVFAGAFDVASAANPGPHMNFPVYPTDEVPKVLQGTDIQRYGWFPWVEGICTDTNGQPVYLVGSLNVGFGGPRFSIIVRGTTLSVTFNSAIRVWNASTGVLTVGNMPRIAIDYHEPHHINVEFDTRTYANLTFTYRDILWYGKSTNPSNDSPISHYIQVGGYDAPSLVSGTITRGTTTVSFSGYGDYENTWLFGSVGHWSALEAKWIIFNDANYAGAVVKCWDETTGQVILQLGRVTDVNRHTSLVFNNYNLLDDGRQPTDSFSLKCRNFYININLSSQSPTHYFANGVWSQFVLVGTINGRPFDGTAWTEYQNNSPNLV
jgi:hypothetical protein